MDALVAATIGAAIGALTGLLPGLHVNLIAAVALTLPDLSPGAAYGLLAVGLVHTFVTILPTTYLGAPDADGALAVLPAHQLLHEGAAPEAVRLSLYASMMGALAAIALWWPYHWIITQPAALDTLRLAAPTILFTMPAWLAFREPRRGPATAVALAAAAVGWIGWSWPVQGWIHGAATPLLPMLSGLFGVPTMLWAIRSQQRPPTQQAAPDRVPKDSAGAVARGVAAAAVTAVLPGLTAAVATSIALPSQRHGPRRVLTVLSAVNTAHLVFAMGVLWMLGRTRSGLAISWRSIQEPLPWGTLPPPDAIVAAGVMLIAGALAVIATVALDRPYRQVLLRLPAGAPESAALALIVALVAATTGWLGLLLLLTCTVVGLLPLALGIRRIHLATSLSIPIAIRLLN